MDIIVNLYDKKCTDFNNNGICVLKPLECVVTEEINGDYSLEMTLSQTETMVEEESIIKVPVPTGTDIFRVYAINTTLNGSKTVSARHISYDMLTEFIEDTRPTNCNGSLALNLILKNTKFKGACDIDILSTAYYEMTNPINALIGADNAFITRWGGEMERTYYTLNVWSSIGSDRGVTIRYGKNLTGLDLMVDMSEVITRIMPTGVKDSNSVLKLPEKYIDSPLINSYAKIRTTRIHYSDIAIGDEVTQEQAYALLRNAARAEYASGLDKPAVSGTVDFIALQNTEEYKDVEALESVYLGDTVTVYHPKLNINLTSRVVSYRYDALAKRYNSLVLGKVLPVIGAANSSASKPLINTIKTETSELKQEFERATDAITGQTGGNVVLNPKEKPREILIMDTDSILTARNVWRWNLSGLAHSKYGYNGPFGQAAITADGRINANFITTGSLSAGIVKSGALVSRNGRLVFNLDAANLSIFDEKDNQLMQFNANGQFFYDNNTYIGTIGRAGWATDPTKKGILFSLEPSGDYMAWCYRDTNDTNPIVQFIYSPRQSMGFSPGLHLGCNLYARGYRIVLDRSNTTETAAYGTGGGIRTTTSISFNQKTDSGDRVMMLLNATGNIHCYRNMDMHNLSILNQSDARLKTNICDSNVCGLDIINRLQCKEFDWIDDEKHQKIGFIAQQVEMVEPDLVHIDSDDGHYSIKPVEFIPYLVKAIQELSREVNQLKSQNNQLRFMQSMGKDSDTYVDTMSLQNKIAYAKSLKDTKKMTALKPQPLNMDTNKEESDDKS